MPTGKSTFRSCGSLGSCAVSFGLSMVLACAACSGSRTVAAGALGDTTAVPEHVANGTDEPQNESGSNLLNQQQMRQLQVFGPILLNPSSDIDSNTRRNAAHELIEMNATEATELLAEALRSRKAPVMLAAASALYASRASLPELSDPAVIALVGAPAEALEPLSWLVSQYGEPALRRVAELATNKSNSVDSRLGPIYALGSFRSRSAAVHLISIVQSGDSPAPANTNGGNGAAQIMQAACMSLERLTGLPHGTNAARWSEWWRDASMLSDDQWYRLVADSLSRRIAELQQQLIRESAANQLAARELAEAYRDLYPALTTDEQLRRLPKLLDDQLPAVREFGINRISLLLRDSVRIPVEIQTKLAQRLGDEIPALRLAAARLLDELNYESTGEVVAARLTGEKNNAVIQGYLEVLAKRPCLAAVEPLRRMLRDRELGPASASTMWQILGTLSIDDAESAALIEASRAAYHQLQSPPLARLLAFIGDTSDTADMTALLDSDDRAMRVAVAEGFARRGMRQPLLDRADDPDVFAFAVNAIVHGEPTLANFTLLARLNPPESQTQMWLDGLQVLADRLGPLNVISVDDLLASISGVSRAHRQTILLKALEAPSEQLGEARSKIIVRVVPLLLEHGQPTRAHDLLESIPVTGTAQVQALRFKAAVLSGHYDAAANLNADPREWLALLSTIVERDATAATPLRDEIERRFAGKLVQDDQARFDRLTEQLQRAALGNVTPPVPQ
jgi:hypothetical protein